MQRYICIHGHFYQPPRENPWLETIEIQDSARPYHDWNERITEECYRPNASSRILDGRGRITDIVNNYSRISFNVGPTLLAWMENSAPSTYRAILEADRSSTRRFSGHGSAMGQAYNHMILPLANHRDKVTQVRWGLFDFEKRFGRRPEGMWLPETAADVESLEVLAREGIRFTVLAPNQASRVRETGSADWTDVSGGRIDPTRPYEIELPSGNRMALFFYDGPISKGVAFEGLLNRGEDLANRLLGVFNDDRDWPELVHIATDGETYGHHHRHGEMALSYALQHIETNGLARITNYAEYLERHPPTALVEIHDNSSWSCVHGVERWRSDCGCHTGGRPGWNQAWRGPLRESLDWLRDTLASPWEDRAGEYLEDPWAARDAYVEVILDRSDEVRDRFLERHASRPLEEEDRITVWRLLELQRHAMLMYTSCGWFFDELSGIETVQVIQYAGRAVQLAAEVLGRDLEASFEGRLEQAHSNLPEMGDGKQIYERFVRPTRLDLTQVGAHFALSSLFEQYPERVQIYCYGIDSRNRDEESAGRVRFAAGQLRVASDITTESEEVSYAVLHMGDHNLNAGVRRYMGEDRFRRMADECKDAFRRADFVELLRLMDRHFQGSTTTVKSLFRDEQRKVLDGILEGTLSDVAAEYWRIYEEHLPLMRFLAGLNMPQPHVLEVAAEFVLNTRLRNAIEAERMDVREVEELLEHAHSEKIDLDAQGLSMSYLKGLKEVATACFEAPWDLALLRELDRVLGLVPRLPFTVDLSFVQNGYYQLLQSVYREVRKGPGAIDHNREQWIESFEELGRKLYVQVA